MNATTICTRRAWIREQIRNLEELYDKVSYRFPNCVCLLSIKEILVSTIFLDKTDMGFERRTISYTDSSTAP